MLRPPWELTCTTQDGIHVTSTLLEQRSGLTPLRRASYSRRWELEGVRSERAHGRTHGIGRTSAGYGDDYFASRGIPSTPKPSY
eukprot:12367067-Heterocapsa_arctica.AAC.1